MKVAIRYGDGVHLSVEDDGRGFADAGGRAQREARRLWPDRRCASAPKRIGGRLRVEFPGRGTRVVVEIPKEADAH